MQSQKEEKKQTYEVWVLRHSENHILGIVTEKYDESFEKWKSLTDLWISCIKDKTPYTITNPVVTAFDPGDIREITIRSVIPVTESKYENPYHQKMMKDGLGNTLKTTGNFVNPDILDGGYR